MDEIIGMYIQGVPASYVREMLAYSPDIEVEDIIRGYSGQIMVGEASEFSRDI